VRAKLLPISSPCDRRFDELEPTADDARRYCDRCRTHVHHLSRMREREARALLADADGRVCIAYRQRGGDVQFLDSATRLLAAASVAAVVSACTPHEREGEIEERRAELEVELAGQVEQEELGGYDLGADAERERIEAELAALRAEQDRLRTPRARREDRKLELPRR
jgi:hypothetical protein